MKRLVLSMIVLCLWVGLASADYVNPPGWDNDPYFTHQSWSFSDASNPSNPDDGGLGNPYGMPSIEIAAGTATWNDDLGMVFDFAGSPQGSRQGGWKITGPRDDEQLFAIDIPNFRNPNMYKELWFEIIFAVTDMNHAGTITDNVSIACYADGIIDGAHEFTYLSEEEDGEAFGINLDGNIWMRYEGKFRYEPQPEWERLVLVAGMEDGQLVLLDQVDIDTHCVPEPATMALLGIGAFGLIRRKR